MAPSGADANAGAPIIIADTNAAYILYFFIDCSIITHSNITLPSGKTLKFHSVVLKEITAHHEAWTICQGLGASKKPFPEFFDTIQSEGIDKIITFVKQNMANHAAVNFNSLDFSNRRKVYEMERQRLQAEWKKTGLKGRKVSSVPSNNDYSILFSAEREGCAILTNDEILLSVAHEFLDDGFTFRAEDIVREMSSGAKDFSEQVEGVAKSLTYLKIPFILSKALDSTGQ